MSDDEAVVIQIRQADVGRLFDRLVVLLVLLAVLAGWLAQPGHPLSFTAIVALLALSWYVPRFFNARRRAAGACRPGSLCAQAKVDYLVPETIRLGRGGTLDVRWPGERTFCEVTGLRVLHLGPLVQLALSSSSGGAQPRSEASSSRAAVSSGVSPAQVQPASAASSPFPALSSASRPTQSSVASPLSEFSTLEITPSIPITDRDVDPSSEGAAQPLVSTPSGSSLSGTALLRGSCLLSINRLPPAEAAALRRWLLWRRRGGD